jgi:glycosyltransferase involved in cell wall biosynthesis
MPRFQTLRSLIRSPLGQRVKPLARWSYSRLLTSLGMAVKAGGQSLDPGKPTALVVSHEASTTGAPILALNLAQQLSGSHNVVVLLLRGGPLLPQFQASATGLILARRQFVNRKLVKRALAQASQGQAPSFALVNSVVSAPLLEPLRGEGIACLCLVHEFVTYIKPLDVFSEVGLWASRVVCSTPLTWNDVLRHCSHLADVPLAVLPQGRCQLPAAGAPSSDGAPAYAPEGAAEQFLKQLPNNTLLVLGAGAVQPRKGVDLFVAVADQIRRLAPELPIHFAWIGSGYAPNHDFSVSVWLKDQIERSGLSNQLTMLDESPAYTALIERSDLFVVSSRLDPLPNVAIDAMLAGTPVLCFAEACGIANLLEQQPLLHSAGVAPYFDCNAMARKAVALLRSPQRLKQLGEITREQANRWFHMPAYIRQLVDLAGVSGAEVRQEQDDLERVRSERLINSAFCFPGQRLSELALHQRYLLSWRSNIRARKPFPGFHPGIYREQQLPVGSRRDPLAHWQEQGKPSGPWQVPVIEPSSTTAPLPAQGQVALHIHVFYPELLAPILERLTHNRVQPDLFVSYSDPEVEPAIRQVLASHQQEASLHPVPNRGRDIGPLLSELGQHLDRSYAFHGHLHTKKSVLIDGGTATRWREFLLINLLGDAERPMADRILAAMQADPELGLVFPDDPGCLGWTENRPHAEALAAQLEITNLPEAINFPVGTMFWARQGALSRLYNLGVSWDDYPSEPLGYDGTMLHAIERLLPQICLASGQRYAVTHVPGFSR